MLALSYRWYTALHPDPLGTTLAAVRRYVRSEPAAMECGLFWDFASLFQKPRTEAEDATFAAGLRVMANLYASAVGTCVLQLPEVPPRPSEQLGAVRVCRLPHHLLEPRFRNEKETDLLCVPVRAGVPVVS